jgi:hypothetical protein
MSRNITKVTTKSKVFLNHEPKGWASVLADIRSDITYLQKLETIVERKIERREAWPGNGEETFCATR